MKRGFTLIEALITIAIFGALFAGFARVYVSFSNLYTFTNSAHNAQIVGGKVIRATEAALFPADRILSTHTFTQGTYGSNSSTLVVEMPSVDSSGNLLAGDFDYAAIYSSGSTAYEIVNIASGSARRSGTFTLGGGVSSLSFTYDASDVTQAHQASVTIVTTSGSGKNAATSTLTETIRGRNLNP